MEETAKDDTPSTAWKQFPAKKPFVGKPLKISNAAIQWAESQNFRSTDVIITTFPKTGTTWLQTICEQLRCGGTGYDHFDEISRVVPWLEVMHEVGQTLEEQNDRPWFRSLKSHQLLSVFPSHPRFLSCVRNPEDVLLSWHSFGTQKKFLKGYGTADAYVAEAPELFGGQAIFGTNVWDFYVELWEARNEPNVLVLPYEDFKQDGPEYEHYIPLIAKLVGVEDEAGDGMLYKNVAKWADWKMMKQHSLKFDGNMFAERNNKKGDLIANVSKIDTHRGNKPKLQETTKLWLKQQWKERVTPKTGHETYEDFAADFVALYRN